MMGFCHESILILCSQNLLFFFFYTWNLNHSYGVFPTLKCRRILSIFSRPCIVLLFQLFNLCGSYSSVCWKVSVKLIFFQMADQLFQKYVLKSSLLQWFRCYIYYMLHFPMCGIYFWTFFFFFPVVYSCTYITLFSLGDFIVCFNVPRQLLLCKFSFRDFLAILTCLFFYLNFRLNLSSSLKMCVDTFIGIALNWGTN